VILLGKYSQEELKRGHALALEKRYKNKTIALKPFIKKENDNVKQRKPKSNVRRLPARKGSNGISRSKQTTNVSTTVQRRIAVRKGKSKGKTLFRSRSPKLVAKT